MLPDWLFPFFLLPHLSLNIIQIVRQPQQLLCDCGMFKYLNSHPKTWLLFVKAVCSFVVLLSSHSVYTRVTWLFLAVYDAYLWWKHSKKKRNKLKDKVLGIVKETVAGLKVVPVATGSAAFVLALSACGAPPQETTPDLTDDGFSISETHQRLSDGRTVTCLVFRENYKGGLSCDWAGAK